MSTATLKRGLLLFWALWLGLVAVSNFFSLMKALGLVHPRLVFASHNFSLVRSFFATYHLPAQAALVAFAGVVLWQFIATGLLVQAAVDGARKTACTALGVTAALFAAFLLAGEFFLRFDFEAVHMRALTAQLVSLLVIYLVPSATDEG